jgi:hypothetical protein
MVEVEVEFDFTSQLADIHQLLPATQSDLNPSQAALVAALALDLRPKVDYDGNKIYSPDILREYSSLLLTLSGNPELGDELRTKVNEYSIAMFQIFIDSYMNSY